MICGPNIAFSERATGEISILTNLAIRAASAPIGANYPKPFPHQ